jgi:hypothetical protein
MVQGAKNGGGLMEMAYKVVGPNRESINFAMYLHRYGELRALQLITQHPELKQYLKYYIKGELVWSDLGRAGLLCFDSYDNAVKFAIDTKEVKTSIIKVKGLGRLKDPKLAAGAWDIYCLLPMRSYMTRLASHMNEGTIAYKAVRVLT